GFEPFAMTTGSRGLHVDVAIRRGPTYAEVNAWAREVAAIFAATDPKRLTTEFRIEKRNGRLFIDAHRNAYAQHAVAPYAVRALPREAVAQRRLDVGERAQAPGGQHAVRAQLLGERVLRGAVQAAPLVHHDHHVLGAEQPL